MAEMKTYLGDGLYAEFDGFQVKLYASNGVTHTNVVYLEPDVLQSFISWISQLTSAMRIEEAKARVRAKHRNAFVSFLVTGDHAEKACAVIRVETSNDGRRHPPRALSDKFVYEGEALGKEQQEAEAKAWLSAAAREA